MDAPAVTADKAEHSFISCKWELPETYTPQQMGQCFPDTDWGQKPGEVKMVWLWRKALLWGELRGEAVKQGCVNDFFLCWLNPPPFPPAHRWNSRDENLCVDHLNPIGKRRCLSVPRTIVPECLQRLKLRRASNHLCSAYSTVELGAVEGLCPPVHSSNTKGNNYGKGMASAQSIWGPKAHMDFPSRKWMCFFINHFAA